MWLLLPLMVVGLHVVIRAHALVDEDDSVRDEHIAHFLDARKQLSPLCLYIFDRTKRLPEYEKNSTATPHGSFFEDHLPGVCPFGDLQFDSALVTTLNTEAHSYQLGVRIERDPGNSTKRIQIASTDIVPVDDFYNLAVIASDRNENTGKRSGGITFEIVVRRRSPEDDNTEMTLFSIANLYSGCVDRGFRVDVDKDRKLVLLYYLPMVDGDKEGSCYEQRLISDQKVLFTDMRTACLFPKSSPSPEGNPPVSIVVTIDPSSSPGLWNTEFLLSYSDPTTMERVSCRVSAQQNPPRDASVQKQRLRGNYRLYIGNNPHNVSSPKVPRPMVPRRQFRPFGSDDTPQTAMGQLRDTLLTKLMTIEGPRIPQAMRIFGDKSFSLSIFGIELPPMNEDTPFAYLRGKLKDFLVMNGDKMVDGLINMLRKMQPIMDKVEQTPGERLVQRWIDQQENDTKFQFYPDAQVSSFDLFHFAIYKKALTPDELDAGNWTQPTALRRFRAPSREIRIREDEVVLVDLLDLHSVFDDLTLELRALPEFGKLMLYPNKTVVTTENMAAFRELPLPYQKKIFYQPNPDESNENIQLPNPIALSRRRRPYSTIEFGIWKSLTGRPFNATATASIHIFVDAVNDPPRPLKPVLE
uniref:Cadherin domain-containing protein n=1 Tax=Globisporangium ultimum (strain ATCC 200006 / CBS 805.95 / DAOM BR144) TaxID=431595 RepID=K3WA80_GLOUD